MAYLVFDVLYAGGELLIDRPLRERARILDELLAAEKIVHHGGHGEHGVRQDRRPSWYSKSKMPNRVGGSRHPCAGVSRAFAGGTGRTFCCGAGPGQRRLDDQRSRFTYTPGKRGKSWLKMKRELATLDVVVTAVEYGHGKRVGVLSDYTFACVGYG